MLLVRGMGRIYHHVRSKYSPSKFSVLEKGVNARSTSLRIKVTSQSRKTHRVALLSHTPRTWSLLHQIPSPTRSQRLCFKSDVDFVTVALSPVISSSPAISFIQNRWTRQCSKLHHPFLHVLSGLCPVYSVHIFSRAIFGCTP
ncbi:hypothetical protein BDR04DRAFT_1146472 [Suillus decipiens]|nr:hypothetical protein BDR04DRAFT_1146472 [Suillus decipiens]